MSMLMMLKEGGSLGIDTIGNLPIDEDIDLLPDTGGAISLAFREIMKHFLLLTRQVQRLVL